MRVPRGALRGGMCLTWNVPPSIGGVTNRELPKKGGAFLVPSFDGERRKASADTAERSCAIDGGDAGTQFCEPAWLGRGNFATFPTPDNPSPTSETVRTMSNPSACTYKPRELLWRKRLAHHADVLNARFEPKPNVRQRRPRGY